MIKTIDELNTMKILYVEDDEVIAQAFITMVSRVVSHVKYCKNGKEALEEFNDFQPDIVITDIKMPIINGLDMAKEIRKIDDEIPIIILSAYNEIEYLKDALEIGITYYLNKPVNRFVLMRALNESAKSVIYKSKQDEIVRNYEETIDAFVDLIERRDRYTAGHSTRVALYSVMLAKAMNIEPSSIALLEKASKLHDIGKIEIPDAILLNPNKLNKLEYAIVQEHLNSGYAVLSKIEQYKELSEIMRYHHERYDGSGYPDGLKGDAIPFLSQIMALCDAFDAMTTNRIYKPRKSVQEALNEIQSLSGVHFNPKIVTAAMDAFKDIIIHTGENQLPKTVLEEKKFSYFFSDLLTGLYNENYLRSLLTNKDTNISKLDNMNSITILDLHNFSAYNKKNGWKSGDELIKRVANYLTKEFQGELVFRIKGDEFYILSENSLSLSANEIKSIINYDEIYFDIREKTLEEFLKEEFIL